MDRARHAQALWAHVPLSERLRLLGCLRAELVEDAEALAASSADARRRPLSEVLTAEVMPLVAACRFLEDNAPHILRPLHLGRRGLPAWLAGTRTEITREPHGVVLIIAPGNYPLFLPGAQAIQALVAGNAVLLKPAPGGLKVAQHLIGLMRRAGFPTDLALVLPEGVEQATAALASGPDKVVFTGTSTTGTKILRQLAETLTPSTMELSGNDAVILRADADVDLAARAVIFGLRLNAGATCMGPRRIFAPASLGSELEGRLAAVAAEQPAFELDPATSLRLRPLLEEALQSGAHFICGGLREDGIVLAPVVLGGGRASLRLMREDVFAPVATLMCVPSDEAAVAQTNHGPYSLGASVFSRDEAAARNLAEGIHAGVVTINDLILPTADPRVPFGGRSRSGFGVTRGAEGLLEMTAPKVVSLTRNRFRPALQPPQPGDQSLCLAYLNLAHGRDWRVRGRAFLSLLTVLIRRTRNPQAK